MSTLLLCSILHYYLLLSKSKSKGKSKLPLPPGPKGLPLLGNIHQLGPKPHLTIHQFSKLYGPLLRLRFGTCELLIVSSSAVAEQIFRAHDLNFSNRPQTPFGQHLGFDFQDLVFAPYGPRWRALRKLLVLHLFSPKALNDLHAVRESEASLFVRTLYGRANHEPVDMAQTLNVCLTNIISRSLFSQPVFGHGTSSADATEFKEMVDEYFRLAGSVFLADYMPALSWLDVYGHYMIHHMKKLRRRFELFFDKVIKEHSKAAKDGDLLSVLMKLKEEGGADGTNYITYPSIKALVLEMFIAGTDTSATSIEWGLSEMLRHPGLLREAQKEIDSVVGRDRLVRESDLPNLPMVQAIVKENFRLHPPGPLSVTRIATEACEVDGYRIPKNTRMMLNIWALGRDPSTWPDPLEFRPERFLPGGGQEHIDVKGKDFEMMTFGGGRRSCVGLSMGTRIVQLLTATLIHAFDWPLPEGQEPETFDMEDAFGLTLKRKFPLMLRPIPRLAEQAYESVW